MFGLCLNFILVVLIVMPVLSLADSKEPMVIVIKNHQFDPAQLTVPANERFQVKVENQDPTAEEFESYDLNREKVVNGNKSIIVFLGPLAKGSYKYFGDFHQNTAQGVIIAQ